MILGQFGFSQLLHLTIVVIISFISHQTNGEIHRAKSTAYKSDNRPVEPTLGLSDFEAVSDVAKMLVVEGTQDDGGGGGIGTDVLKSTRQIYEMWIYSILGAMLVGLSGIFPLLVIPIESGPALKHGEPAKKLRLMLSFAVGSLLGDVFLHLLPEVWAHIDKTNHGAHTKIGLWVIFGLLSFMIIEKLMGNEHEFDPLEDTCDEVVDNTARKSTNVPVKQTAKSNNTVSQANGRAQQRKGKKGGHSHNQTIENTAKLKHGKKQDGAGKSPAASSNNNNIVSCAKPSEDDDSNSIKVSGYLNLMANVVDNFTHGLAVAGSFCISTKVGLITTLAILLHEIPHEVGDFAILLRSGFSRWKAAKAQFFTASGGVIGAVTALSAESAQIAGDRTAWILPFTSGGFMYIALVTVVPDLLQERHGWESLKQIVCICLGVLSMVLVTLLFD